MPQTDDPAPRDPDFVQSLDRGLAVIRAFGPDRPVLTLSEVARETGMSRAAARRFLHTLVDLGYVGTDGREFHLRPRLLELGYAYLSGLSLPQVAQPHLQHLSDEVHESSSAAILDGHDIVYVARSAVSRIMSVAIGVGTRFPAYATSMGRVLLAGLDDDALDEFLRTADLAPRTTATITDPAELRAELTRVRERGWALVDQELEAGVRSVAAPVRDAAGRVIAAVNVAAPARRSADDEAFVLPLRRAAAAISEDLARTGIRLT
ncbi:IclR family transcriptional regulator domain-containing protein [Agromyces seonyuensis]|uniref:Helix-turn-helix domain-containing protein n=1 Tax=Agromyces seonyuensis TaxID=2662446 RepID=A0A6I4NSQ8_9MICO|nr:IclR family transcriptional regulator C-terminal domain-containing protein [Agromyces seonyuensis]MWB97210.1 helix-turn-helix domain-containing protein [Agromyces seonyuensis]